MPLTVNVSVSRGSDVESFCSETGIGVNPLHLIVSAQLFPCMFVTDMALGVAKCSTRVICHAHYGSLPWCVGSIVACAFSNERNDLFN